MPDPSRTPPGPGPPGPGPPGPRQRGQGAAAAHGRRHAAIPRLPRVRHRLDADGPRL